MINVFKILTNTTVEHITEVSLLFTLGWSLKNLLLEEQCSFFFLGYQRSKSLTRYYKNNVLNASEWTFVVIVMCSCVFICVLHYRVVCMSISISSLIIIPLHSSIHHEEQLKAFLHPANGKRKVILATNIAESSITVPDIHYGQSFIFHVPCC